MRWRCVPKQSCPTHNRNSCGDTHITVHLPLVTSLAQSISVSSLIIRPFSALQRAKLITQATPAKSSSTLPAFIQSAVLLHSSPISISVSLETNLSSSTSLRERGSLYVCYCDLSLRTTLAAIPPHSATALLLGQSGIFG